jgi:lysyl-tRNA synthetase class 2
VRRLPLGTPVRVGARVVACAPHGRASGTGTEAASTGPVLTVEDAGGRLEVAGNRSVPLGSWVVVEGVWRGDRVAEAAISVEQVPHVPFPPEDGDWAWFQADQGTRLSNLQARAAIRASVRRFFDERRFLEVDTPQLVPCPGLDVHLDAFPVGGNASAPLGWLSTSPEYQMKRLLAAGAPRVYQIAHCFRQHERGRNHEPEFTMLEWYRAFADSDALIRETEQLVAHVATAQRGSTVIPAFDHAVDVAPPWDRLTVADAFQRYAGVSVNELLPDEERFFRVLVERVEPHLGRGRPTVLSAWPASMASLARLDPKDPTVADRFEIYVDGVELSNGFGELIDPVEQRARFERDQRERSRLEKPVYPLDERFLAALEEGLPPCAGNALGFDRLVMLVLGVPDIRDVVPFAHDRL